MYAVHFREDSKTRICVADNMLFLFIRGKFNDSIMYDLLDKMDEIMQSIDGPIVRIWENYKQTLYDLELSGPAVRDATMRWNQIMKERPGTILYALTDSDVAYGLARMFELQSDIEQGDVIVLRSHKELPERIKNAYIEARQLINEPLG